MLFPTLHFILLFALVVYPLSWLLRRRDRPWKLFILAASYAFYGYWDWPHGWRFVGLLILSSAVNWAVGERLEPASGRRRQAWLALGVLFNLAVLGVFKYYGFFIESANASLLQAGLAQRLPLLEIVLPVGISFFTFQGISYVVDLYRRSFHRVSLSDFFVYQAFFPHLVAGPIVRAAEFVPQIAALHWLTRPEATQAGLLIARGAFKKVVISGYLATAIVDPVFGVPAEHSALEIRVAIYAYAVQIYADFSGYTDMAIGLALLLGFRFPQNFDRPYIAANIQEFWRRWHMTLSRWLRDYLYRPLGGSRKGEARTYVNLILTMTLGGLWHGAAAHFLVWGLYHGLGLSLHRAWQQFRSRPAPPAAAELGVPALSRALEIAGPAQRARSGLGAALSWFLTFQFVCVGWVLFRAQSLADAWTMLERALTAWGPAPLVTVPLLATILLMLASQFVPLAWSERFEARVAGWPLVAQGAALGLAFALILALAPSGVLPFIYFQF
jgi:D-alanyl-lipoteichoic acid acyltransferase DltB (MBOAT superfamily)